MPFAKINYANLNARQKENYNFQKVSAVLADYGFVTIRLSDDWQGADFIAHHVTGSMFMKVQLKGRLTLDTKYTGKDIWICFHRNGVWYLFPHDDFLRWTLRNLNVSNTEGWTGGSNWRTVRGIYSWSSPNKTILAWLQQHALN